MQTQPSTGSTNAPLSEVCAYLVDSVETSYTINGVTRSSPDDLALEVDKQSSCLKITIGRSSDASRRDNILSKKISEALKLDPAAVHLVLTSPMDTVEALLADLGVLHLNLNDEDDEMINQLPFDPTSIHISLDRKSHRSPDFQEMFSCARPRLEASALRSPVLKQSHTYQLNYKSGVVDVAQNEESAFEYLPRSDQTSLEVYIAATLYGINEGREATTEQSKDPLPLPAPQPQAISPANLGLRRKLKLLILRRWRKMLGKTVDLELPPVSSTPVSPPVPAPPLPAVKIKLDRSDLEVFAEFFVSRASLV